MYIFIKFCPGLSSHNFGNYGSVSHTGRLGYGLSKAYNHIKALALPPSHIKEKTVPKAGFHLGFSSMGNKHDNCGVKGARTVVMKP